MKKEDSHPENYWSIRYYLWVKMVVMMIMMIMTMMMVTTKWSTGRSCWITKAMHQPMPPTVDPFAASPASEIARQ